MFDYDEKESGYGWCVVACSFLLHAVVCGISYSCGVTHQIFRDYFNQPSHFVTSWIGTTMLAMTVLAGIPGTLLTYKLGYRLTVITGGILATAGMALSGFCTEYWQVLLTFGVLTGFGFGISLTPSVMIIENYFYTHRTMALSCVIAGSSVGMIFIPVTAYHLEEKYAWKGMALIFAGLCLNIVLCGVAFRQKDGVPMTPRERRSILKIFEPRLCGSTAFAAICVSNFVWSFGAMIVYMYLPGYAIRTGQTPENAAVLIGVIGLSAAISRPMFQLFGHSAKLDHTSVILCSVGVTTILTGLHPDMMTHSAGQIGFSIIFGLHVGFWTTFVSLLCGELIGDEFVAWGRGFISLCIGAGVTTGGPLAGWVLDEMDDYEIIFYLAGASMLLSSCILAIANMKRCYFRPMADWCDSDSESSTSSFSKPTNTYAEEDILFTQTSHPDIRVHEASPDRHHDVITSPDRHHDVITSPDRHHDVIAVQQEAAPCSSQRNAGELTVTLRGHGSGTMTTDPVFRYSAFQNAPETDV